MNDIWLFVHTGDPGTNTREQGLVCRLESSWCITKGLIALQKLPQPRELAHRWHRPTSLLAGSVSSEGEQAGEVTLGGHRWGFWSRRSQLTVWEVDPPLGRRGICRYIWDVQDSSDDVFFPQK